jgi:hypothetical protein
MVFICLYVFLTCENILCATDYCCWNTAGESAEAQPYVCIASYQKRFRGKVRSTLLFKNHLTTERNYSSSTVSIIAYGISQGRVDKMAGTIESDPDFLAFQKQLQQPAEKLPSAEIQLEAREKLAVIAQAAQDAFVKKETAKLKAAAAWRDKARGSSSKTDRAIRLAIAANLADKESAEAIKVGGISSRSGRVISI